MVNFNPSFMHTELFPSLFQHYITFLYGLLPPVKHEISQILMKCQVFHFILNWIVQKLKDGQEIQSSLCETLSTEKEILPVFSLSGWFWFKNFGEIYLVCIK